MQEFSRKKRPKGEGGRGAVQSETLHLYRFKSHLETQQWRESKKDAA